MLVAVDRYLTARLTESRGVGSIHSPEYGQVPLTWTRSGDGSAQVGHHDRTGLDSKPPAKSWNHSHPSRGCSVEQLQQSGSAGLMYCFATN